MITRLLASCMEDIAIASHSITLVIILYNVFMESEIITTLELRDRFTTL